MYTAPIPLPAWVGTSFLDLSYQALLLGKGFYTCISKLIHLSSQTLFGKTIFSCSRHINKFSCSSGWGRSKFSEPVLLSGAMDTDEINIPVKTPGTLPTVLLPVHQRALALKLVFWNCFLCEDKPQYSVQMAASFVEAYIYTLPCI